MPAGKAGEFTMAATVGSISVGYQMLFLARLAADDAQVYGLNRARRAGAFRQLAVDLSRLAPRH